MSNRTTPHVKSARGEGVTERRLDFTAGPIHDDEAHRRADSVDLRVTSRARNPRPPT